MNFVTVEFAIFLLSVLALLFLTKNPLIRKVILLVASCLFYAWWDWRFLGLLVALTVINFYLSRLFVRTDEPRKRKILFILGIVVNLSFLGFFKYFDFFLGTLNSLTKLLGWHMGMLNIILPLGISFYTFEMLSYIIDVYHGVVPPAKSLLDYAVFTTFFPCVVSGPILRAKQFLPQLESGIQILPGNLVEGAQLFLRGLLMKMVIADNVAIMVDQVYKSASVLSSATVWLGVLAYSIQIFCNFSGYTDMARGVGKMLGFELPQNFNLPYASQSITEFWRRWHITLSNWLRDYIFYPIQRVLLQRSQRPPEWVLQSVPLMVTMVLCGLWHGPSWLFIVWGGLHGAYLVFERMAFGGKLSQNTGPSLVTWVRALLVFGLVSITWVPFRSPNWETALLIFKKLLFFGTQYHFEWFFVWAVFAVPMIVVGGLLARRFEWKWPILSIQKSYTPAFLLLEILIIFFFAPLNSNPFIYFRF